MFISPSGGSTKCEAAVRQRPFVYPRGWLGVSGAIMGAGQVLGGFAGLTAKSHPWPLAVSENCNASVTFS